MPAKKGKRENVKAEAAVPENTEEPVVKKGRAGKEAAAVAEKAEKVKKVPAPKGKAKKTADDEVAAAPVPAVVPDVETTEEENGAETKNGAQEDKPKRGRAKKDAAKKTDVPDEPVEKRETRGRKAKQTTVAKEEPAPKVAKTTAKAPAKPKPAKEPKGKATKAAPAAKEEDDEEEPEEVPEAKEPPKEAPKPKGRAKGRGKQAAAAAAAVTVEENVVDEKGDAKVGSAAEGPEDASVDVEACKS